MIRRIVVGGRPLVAKSAIGEARRGLRREAELLGHLDGLPVVALVALRESDDRTDLVTRDSGTHDLSAPCGLRPDALLAALAATADAVSRMHAAGWSHGAICGEHVVIGREGRVTLCSLGSAGPLAADEDALGIDLQQLRSLVERVVGFRDPAWSAAEVRRWRRLVRRLRRLERSQPPGTLEPGPFAVRVAAALRGPSSGRRRSARPRVLARPSDRSRRPSLTGLSRAPLRLVAGVTGLGLTALLWGAVNPAGAGDVAAPGGSYGVPERACEPLVAGPHGDVDGDGCPEPIEVDGNQIRAGTLRISAGRNGDQVALGSLTCDHTTDSRVVLLRPQTGEVFGFDDWPTPDRATAARVLGTAPGATVLSTDLVGDCRMATPRRADGAEVVVVTAAAAAAVTENSEDGPPPVPMRSASRPSTEDDPP